MGISLIWTLFYSRKEVVLHQSEIIERTKHKAVSRNKIHKETTNNLQP